MMRLTRPLPLISRQQVVHLSQSFCVSPVPLAEGGGGGRAWSRILRAHEAWPSTINHSMLSEMLSYILLIAESADKFLLVGGWDLTVHSFSCRFRHQMSTRSGWRFIHSRNCSFCFPCPG
jgi:hypothetical protein